MPALLELNRIVQAADLFEWEVTVPTQEGQDVKGLLTANTKSEARAKVKTAFNGKYPAGATLQKTGRRPRTELLNKTLDALVEHIQSQIKDRISDDADISFEPGVDGEVAGQHVLPGDDLDPVRGTAEDL